MNEHEQEVLRESSRKMLFGAGLAFVLATGAFFSGLHFGSVASGDRNLASIIAVTGEQREDVDLSIFWQVWDVLDAKFVSATSTDPLTDEERMWAAIEGLVASYGDPYTVYLPPEDSEIFESDIQGNFEGVGMEIGIRDEVLTVIAPLPDTPAERAGILSEDVIVEIDGESTERMGVDEAVKLIRGEKGTEVMLAIFREGESELLEIPVVRDRIDIPSLETEQRGGTFIIRLFNFSAVSEMQMQEALRAYVRSGASRIVLDLRGNPGGFLGSAVNIASYFLPVGKTIVREDFGNGEKERVYRSSGKTLEKFAPRKIVVLVDGGSASASEILAGALRAHGDATLIGTQTFGKGSVQELVNFRDNSSLKVTIARWLTPDGTSISDGGLTPDIEVAITAEDRSAGRDPQLERALEFVSER